MTKTLGAWAEPDFTALFALAVLCASTIGGLGPGILATLLAAAGTAYAQAGAKGSVVVSWICFSSAARPADQACRLELSDQRGEIHAAGWEGRPSSRRRRRPGAGDRLRHRQGGRAGVARPRLRPLAAG